MSLQAAGVVPLRVFISGGLGAVGGLVALWLASLQPDAEIWLLGRSGRGRMAQLLGSCHAQVVVPRCDTASWQEVAALLKGVAFTHVIHAGMLRRHGLTC